MGTKDDWMMMETNYSPIILPLHIEVLCYGSLPMQNASGYNAYLFWLWY